MNGELLVVVHKGVEEDAMGELKYAKQALISSVNEVIRQVSEDCLVEKKQRLILAQRNKLKVLHRYLEELNSFKVLSLVEVEYDGHRYSNSEPVRRFTKIHLEYIKELRQYGGIYLGEVQSRYEEAIGHLVKMM